MNALMTLAGEPDQSAGLFNADPAQLIAELRRAAAVPVRGIAAI
ncbi:hypothetical protein V6U90_17360 [Micromonospora sp. CPCC 206060]